MPKKSFNKIKITDAILAPVDQFNGITARYKERPTLDKKDHEDLVHKKYNDARAMNDHITVFRVQDKSSLAGKEQREHTVPGPIWTPPSSVAFVMGALSNGDRVWLATSPTNDRDGFFGNNDAPSILARETTAVIRHGWIARETQKHEKYGCTSRMPKVVFTPPLSPRNVSTKELKSLMNVNASWDMLPIKLDNLIRLSIPLPKKVTDFLKKFKLTTAEVDDSLLRMISQDGLSLLEVNKAPAYVARELLLNKEVVVLLSDGTIEFAKLLEIYSEYIENSDNSLDEFSFKKLYSLINNENSELRKLFSELGLSIDTIIKLYNEDYSMFYAFANDNAISFLQEYGEEIDIERMAEIYHENQELFYALINDREKENMLQDIGTEEFIKTFEQAQAEVDAIDEDSPYYGSYSAYDLLVGIVREEGCPEGYGGHNDSSEEEDEENDRDRFNDNTGTDEDEVEHLAGQFDECYVSGEGRYEYVSGSEYD